MCIILWDVTQAPNIKAGDRSHFVCQFYNLVVILN